MNSPIKPMTKDLSGYDTTEMDGESAIMHGPVRAYAQSGDDWEINIGKHLPLFLIHRHPSGTFRLDSYYGRCVNPVVSPSNRLLISPSPQVWFVTSLPEPSLFHVNRCITRMYVTNRVVETIKRPHIPHRRSSLHKRDGWLAG